MGLGLSTQFQHLRRRVVVVHHLALRTLAARARCRRARAMRQPLAPAPTGLPRAAECPGCAEVSPADWTATRSHSAAEPSWPLPSRRISSPPPPRVRVRYRPRRRDCSAAARARTPWPAAVPCRLPARSRRDRAARKACRAGSLDSDLRGAPFRQQ